MRTTSRPEEIPKNAIATVGNFDGVHLGHQSLLKELKERAERKNSQSLLVTFDPLPALFFGMAKGLLSPKQEKTELLEKNQLQNLLVFDFSDAVAQTEPEDFVERVLVNELKVKEVVIGETHRFGREKSGDVRLLKELGSKWGFCVDVVSPITHRQVPVSSSRIRATLEKGEVEEVEAMLGRRYSLTGKVVKGVGRGRRLKYPTANIEVANLKLLPANGVYAVRVELRNGSFRAVMNIGTRPTFGEPNRIVEVHLLDFDGAIYGESLDAYCIKRLRGEKVFASEEVLKCQIEKDLETAEGLS